MKYLSPLLLQNDEKKREEDIARHNMNCFILVVIKASNSVCIILVEWPKSFQNKTWRKKHPNIRQAKELQNLPQKYIILLQKKENFEFSIVRT